MTDTDDLLARADRFRATFQDHGAERLVADLRTEIKRLQALRCPRCGEWVRDFPGAAIPPETET